MTAAVAYRGGLREFSPDAIRRLGGMAALLYLAVGFGALQLAVFGWPRLEHPVAFLVEACGVVGVGILLLLVFRWISDERAEAIAPAVGHYMLFTAGPGITLGLVTAGPAFRIGSLVYLIHPIFGVYVFPRWRTVLLLTLVGLEYGALLHIQHDVAPAGQWGFFMIILVVTAVITGGLVDQLDRLAASEHDARLALAEASRQKSAFLAAMSHELRTPLNAIIGFSEVLRDRVFGELNEKQEEYVSDVVGSGQHLLALINDILDLSKVEAGRMELEVSAVDVAALVQSAVAFVRADLARNAIALTIELEPEAGVIHGDGQKLRQVLINLLSNAVKFTPDHGSVRVSVTHARGNLVITVADTGPGIAPEDQERIFEEFAQAGAAEQSRQPGTGLGLTLARRFTELHQGRLSVDSVVGVGSTFRLEVPAGG